MKKLFKHTILLLLLAIAAGGKAQNSQPGVSVFMVNERPEFITDSLGIRKLRTDTVQLEILISFANLVKEIKQVHLQIGEVAGKGSVVDETLLFNNSSDKTYMTGLGMNNQLLSYGSNVAFTLKRSKHRHGKWASVAYTTIDGKTSPTTYFKIKD